MVDELELKRLLQKAMQVFSQARDLGIAFQEAGQSRVIFYTPDVWKLCKPVYDTYCETLLELVGAMKNPPKRFEPVTQRLVEAAHIARRIQGAIKTTVDSHSWSGTSIAMAFGVKNPGPPEFTSYWEFYPDLNSVSQKGFEAVRQVRTTLRFDQPFCFLDDIETTNSSPSTAEDSPLERSQESHEKSDTQALEQILIGQMLAIAGEANQIFRPLMMFDFGIDGEVEFKDDDGKASGKRIYVQLKSGNSYLRTRKSDGREVFDVKNERHLEYWINQPVDVYLVIRQQDEISGEGMIRWMNVSRYLSNRRNKQSRQIIFEGEKVDLKEVCRVRNQFFPPTNTRK